MKSCPNCQAQIPDENKFCSKCGYKIPEPTKPKFIYFKGLNNTYLFHCIKCDSEFTSEDGKFCPGCGNKLPDSIDDETLMNCMDINRTCFARVDDNSFQRNGNIEIPFVIKEGDIFARVTSLARAYKTIAVDRVKVPPTLEMGINFSNKLFHNDDGGCIVLNFIDVFKGGKVDYYLHRKNIWKREKCPQKAISDLFDCWER